MSNFSCSVIGIDWEYIGEIEKVSWPLNRVDLKKSNTQLIQMRNGMGKTTTIHLLRHIFSGTDPPESLLSRARFAGGKKSKLGEKYVKKGKLSAKLDINGEQWTIGINMNFENLSSKFFHVNPASGNLPGWDAPSSFRRLFHQNDAFTELFIVDTQEAGGRQTSLNKEIIDGAITGVTNLDSLNELILEIKKTYDNMIIKAGKDPGKRKMTMYDKAVKKIDKLIITAEEGKKINLTGLMNTKEDLKEAKNEKEKLKAKSKMKDIINNLDKEVAVLEKGLGLAVVKLKNSYYSPTHLPEDFWKGVTSLYEELHNLAIPQAITQEVVRRIRKDKICICGTRIKPGSGMEKHLKDFEKHCINSDIQEEALAIKNSILTSKYGDDAEALSKEIIELKKEIKKKGSEIKTQTLRMGKGVAEQIEKLDSRITELTIDQKEKEEWDSLYSCIDAKIITETSIAGNAILKGGALSSEPTDYDDCLVISVLKRGKNHFENKRDELSGIVEYGNNTENVCELIEKTIELTLNYLREHLLLEINKHLKPFQSGQLTVQSLDDGVKYVDAQGHTRGGSNTGAELATQYSIVLALSNMTECKVPLIIDNPTKGLDGNANSYFKSNIPDKVIQLLLIIIPTERLMLKNLIKKSKSASTLYRENEEKSGLDPGDKMPTGKVIISEDRSWFNGYNPPEK